MTSKNSQNPGKMVAGNSPDWLPPGFTEKIKVKNGRKIKVYIDLSTGDRFYSRPAVTRHLKTEGDHSEGGNERIELNNVVEPVLNPVTSVQCESTAGSNNIHEKKKNKSSFTLVSTECTTADGFPPGWIKEIKTSKSGNKIRKDPYYTDPVSGYTFHSRKDALRYLETNDIGSCAITPKRKEPIDLELTKNDVSLEKVVEKPKMSLKRKSVLDSDLEPEKKNKNDESFKSFTTVVSECTSADGFPPGWIKEIKTSKSGTKIRKDTYYIDPVIGYIFLSKKDVFRYLETKDISSCAITPKRKELKDLKLMKNQILNNVDNPDTSRPHRSITDTYSVPEKKSKIKESCDTVAMSTYELPPVGVKDLKKRKLRNTITQDPLNNVDKPETSRPRRSVTDTYSIPEKKTITEESFALVSTSVDDLPPGWIKEIKTSKSGDRIRKDPYYIDPVSGYMFRSKKDVFRYLETNDIRNCAITPKRRELNDLKSTKNVNSTGNVVEKLNSVPEPNYEPEKKNLNNVDNPKPSRPRRFMTDTNSVPEKKTNNNESFAAVSTSTDELPPGWIKEIKTSKSGDRIRKDPYYTHPDSGYIFLSKKDVLRYLETNDIKSCVTPPKRKELNGLKSITNVNSLENVVEKPDMSVKHNSVPEQDSEPEKKNVDNQSFNMLNNVDKPETSRPRRSITDTYSIPEKKAKAEETFATVATSVDGLPPGWTKGIKTRKSGDNIRKDPYYTDPVSGYMFRSKLDAVRYLETNDIKSCAITPKRMEVHDLMSMANANSLNNVEEPGTSRLRRSITNTYSIPEKKTTIEESFATLNNVEEPDTSRLRSTITNTYSIPEKSTALNNVDKPDTWRPLRSITDTYSVPEKSTTIKESFPTLNNVDKPDTWRPRRSITDTYSIPQKSIAIKESFPMFNNMDNPDTSRPCRSITDTYTVPEKKTKSEKPLATVATSADGLPPGWIKEIKTSQSGDRIRKDPYYTHPDSAYIFLSKKDVLRYLETNDIKSCVTPPKRKGKTSFRVDNNLSEQFGTKRQPFVSGESNDGGESSSPKIIAASTTAKILKQMRDAYKSDDSKITSSGADNLEGKNSNNNDPIPQTDVSEQGTRAMDDVLAICSLITEEIAPESEMGKQEESQVGSRKSMKRKDLNLPLQASKKPSSSEANIDRAKEDENFQEIEPLNEVEKEESGKQLNGSITSSQGSENFNGFGDSWSDPCLEFAFKTLTGEMSIGNTFEKPMEGKVPPFHCESSKKNAAVDPSLGNPSFSFPPQSVDFMSYSGLSYQQGKRGEE